MTHTSRMGITLNRGIIQGIDISSMFFMKDFPDLEVAQGQPRALIAT